MARFFFLQSKQCKDNVIAEKKLFENYSMAYVIKKRKHNIQNILKRRKKIKVYIQECLKKKKKEIEKSLTLFNHYKCVLLNFKIQEIF